MTKKRVYELAKEMGMSSKDLMEKINELDLKVGSHMSTIEDEEAELLKDLILEENESDEETFESSKEVIKKKKPKDKDQNIEKNTKNKKEDTATKEEKNNDIISESSAIEIEEKIQVKNLADKLKVDSSKLISKLISLGIMASINQEIDFDTASIIADDFGYKLVLKVGKEDKDSNEIDLDIEDDPNEMVLRSPVVTVMGHVDHGKTSLLDAIRQTNVIDREAGGITQHIGASTVKVNNKKVVFLDTPGHEAFTSMRARGAQLTDIAILVVSADDGVMPQTIEAINHAKAAGVPIIVAINKIDKPDANPDRVKQELTEHGLMPEDWGGDTICVPVSALKNMGIDDLLEMITLVAEMQELKANPNRRAKGIIIEAQLDKGRGPVATVLVQKGTLTVGDSIVAGSSFGKVRAMIDDKGKRVKKVGPSTPVEILGLSEVPDAGEHLYSVNDDKKAREVAEERKANLRREQLKSTQKVSLDYLFEQIKQGEVKDLNIIIKADVKGSIEAVKQSLEKLSTDEVRVNPIHGGVGAITESDIMLASASNAIVIGFNVRPTTTAIELSKRESVDVRTYRIIYNAIEDIEAAIKGMLDPEFEEVVLGRAEIRATFKVPNAGVVGGVYVLNGKITRNSKIRLLRDNIVIHEGSIDSLKRFKDDVKELLTGYEGGLSLEGYNDIKEGDIAEAFILQEVKK